MCEHGGLRCPICGGCLDCFECHCVEYVDDCDDFYDDGENESIEQDGYA